MTGGEEDWSTDDQSYKKEFDLAAESHVETLVNLPGYTSEDRQMDITEKSGGTEEAEGGTPVDMRTSQEIFVVDLYRHIVLLS